MRRHSAPSVNRRIDREVEKSIRYYAGQPREMISRRIRELEGEWDIERVLEANAASFSLVGLTLGITGKRRWLGLSTVVAGFLLLHAIQGWCPPVPVFRRLGIRTRQEIEREKFALRFLRGDFDHLRRLGAEQKSVAAVVEAVAR